MTVNIYIVPFVLHLNIFLGHAQEDSSSLLSLSLLILLLLLLTLFTLACKCTLVLKINISKLVNVCSIVRRMLRTGFRSAMTPSGRGDRVGYDTLRERG